MPGGFSPGKCKTSARRTMWCMDLRSGRRVLIFCGFVIFPFHFRAYKLHGRDAAAQVGSAAFPAHGNRRVMRAARDAVFVQRAVRIRQGKPSVQWNVRFFKRSFFAKQVFIDFDGIESGIAQKIFWLYERMCFKKSFNTGTSAFASARLLSSSGESDFFSTVISGWASRKSLL